MERTDAAGALCASWEVAFFFFYYLRYATAGWNISCLSAQQKYGPVKCEDKIRQRGSFLSHPPLSLQYFGTEMKYISCLAWMNKIPSTIVDGPAFEIHTSWSEAKHVLLYLCFIKGSKKAHCGNHFFSWQLICNFSCSTLKLLIPDQFNENSLFIGGIQREGHKFGPSQLNLCFVALPELL
jgi:hypothetical protein